MTTLNYKQLTNVKDLLNALSVLYILFKLDGGHEENEGDFCYFAGTTWESRRCQIYAGAVVGWRLGSREMDWRSGGCLRLHRHSVESFASDTRWSCSKFSSLVVSMNSSCPGPTQLFDFVLVGLEVLGLIPLWVNMLEYELNCSFQYQQAVLSCFSCACEVCGGNQICSSFQLRVVSGHSLVP